uniref:Large ribosomal subunit protein bL21c n=1 Tax=Cliftonaea pectinata TaxID=2007206 RepID=A0A1Z1MQI8_9FLOR|nr:ribosomal protein L21 [Cliftonaea pectinata]ARW68122.1 ribosomal protein L21 [Cliftonaea pectinata]
MIYAIVDICGSQVLVEPGKFYDVNYIPANPGDIINLNRVLFLGQLGSFKIGLPCLASISIKAKILRHVNNRKLTVFKVKPKKNYRVKKGHRQRLTRLLIESIAE